MRTAIRLSGEASATGVVPLTSLPDYSAGKDTVRWLGAAAYNRYVLRARGLVGSLVLEGNDSDPTNEAAWYTLDTLDADGYVKHEDALSEFIRVRASAITSGTATVELILEF